MTEKMEHIPTCGNRTYSLLRVMFNLSEVWGDRLEGSNPCRHIKGLPERGYPRLITDEGIVKLLAYLDQAEIERTIRPETMLAIRLQFEFAARMSEILLLQWDWIDFENRRVYWPDSKPGPMSKPMSEEAQRLLSNAEPLPGMPNSQAPGDRGMGCGPARASG